MPAPVIKLSGHQVRGHGAYPARVQRNAVAGIRALSASVPRGARSGHRSRHRPQNSTASTDQFADHSSGRPRPASTLMTPATLCGECAAHVDGRYWQLGSAAISDSLRSRIATSTRWPGTSVALTLTHAATPSPQTAQGAPQYSWI